MRRPSGMLFSFLLLILLLNPIATSSDDFQEYNDYFDYNDPILDELDSEGGETRRRLSPEMSNEPPESPSQITNLFYDKMLRLLETNEAQYIDSIAKYTNSETRLLSCHQPGKNLNFAEFNQINRYLFLYFKNVYAAGTSFAPSPTFVRFEVKFRGASQDGKDVLLTWQGEANFDDNLKYFVLSKVEMVGDCSQIPKEFPTGPVESQIDYQNRFQSSLFNDLFLANQPHQRASYQAFVDDFLISRARVQLCEQNGEVKDKGYFIDYLNGRYGRITNYKELEFSKEQFSSYQTDLLFSVTVNDQTRDMYRFRMSAQSEVINGWPHWFVDYVEVMCPRILNPSQNPRDLQDRFVDHVCGSISPMVNNGQSVESRSTFVSHMNSRPDGGFWTIACGRGGSPMGYDQLDEYLSSWSSNYKSCALQSRNVLDYANFEFICNLSLVKDNGSAVKREFKMKAFYETNQWLVKELRVGCDV